MPRGVRVSTVKKTLGNADVQKMFSSALGTDDSVDVDIAWPKFKNVRHHVLRFIKLMQWISELDWLGEYFPSELDQVAKFTAELENEFKETFAAAPDLDAAALVNPAHRALFDALDMEGKIQFNTGVAASSPADVERFSAEYKMLVESDLVKTAVVTCSNLTTHKTHLENIDKLSPRFLLTPGLEYSPINDLLAANFKAFYIDDRLSEGQRQNLLVFLHKLYSVTHDVYEASSAPDIDVDKFVEIITSSLQQVKGQIPRCDDAFKRLESSVGLLRENFGKYYRDSHSSGNPSLLMENFVLDVADSSQGASMSVRAQFKRIIAFYRKNMAAQPKTAETQTLFSELERNFKELEKRESQAEGALDDEDDEAAASKAIEDEQVAIDREAEMRMTGVAKQAREEGRGMNEEERAEHKAELQRRRKRRANAKKNATKSMNQRLDSEYVPSLLYSQLFADDDGDDDDDDDYEMVAAPQTPSPSPSGKVEAAAPPEPEGAAPPEPKGAAPDSEQ